MRIFAALWKKSASSTQWLQRQADDFFTRQAKVDQFRSRAAYKLLQMNKQFKLFRPGMTVVDLGFAPGSWSQVAVEQTKPNGRVIGVDLLQVEPPLGVTAVQGNFLSSVVQQELKRLINNPLVGRRSTNQPASSHQAIYTSQRHAEHVKSQETESIADNSLFDDEAEDDSIAKSGKRKQKSQADLVLSDMCGIWPQTSGFWINSINSSYERLANTSGLIVRDHAASMDLCDAGLMFCIDNLKSRGAFVCKFYTGSEDNELEARLKRLFKKVQRVKPDATRKESREAYFVAKGKKANVTAEEVFRP